ncbi:gluconate 5-dehydrogenase/2-deoxy-D-gluconate 3-dehydrogenase [Thalassobacillus cyri]|uniref:Gluconate 5-dehydrogenase/2-deoxy-D-gluconate 3-dehydrogenase n=1 Tax=Thalassobacillus cyri TaxID=571932 RepID=A0A1H4E2L9_9BACI|nr:glucose 1-dehydrogenase [Thalassobacillus cyri]SEA79008.1 gluconate 5-dehydrogenase/2-deoxy-D-gluconate 3-dehydrogenase [Thalassobacillus cyri]
MFRLDGKVAMITGGSKGIGLGIAQTLGRMGAKVAIASRGLEDLEKAKKSLTEADIEVLATQVDVTSKKSVDNWLKEVIDNFGEVHILINNAGTNIRKPLVEVDESDWERVLDTNLKGVFLAGQAAAKQMIEQQTGGKIVNISSIFGGVGSSFQTSYAASKGGINQLTKVWASELAEHGINVNGLAPGYIKTPMTEGWLNDEERYRGIVDQTMLKRVGDLEDLEGPLLLLASDGSNYMTGQTIYVDGGWTAK